MKFTSTLLTLCAIDTANAFFVQQHKPTLSPSFSYLGSLGGGSPDDNAERFRLSTINGPSDKATSDRVTTIGGESRTKALEQRLAALEQRQTTSGSRSQGQYASPAKDIVETANPVTVQGGSLKTWSFASPNVKKVQVVLGTEGRPLDADVQLWQGPDNTPHKMRVYVEDGSLRPFNAVIDTPRGPNTIAIRNTGQLEFPLSAYVVGDVNSSGPAGPAVTPTEMKSSRTIQGGALRTYPFDPSVESVQVLLKTDGRPLNARIELLQGPNNNKQVIEIYTEDGKDRPFYAVIETPGSGNVVRVVNTATVEFPLTAWVEPFAIGSYKNGAEPVIGGDTGGFMLDRQW